MHRGKSVKFTRHEKFTKHICGHSSTHYSPRATPTHTHTKLYIRAGSDSSRTLRWLLEENRQRVGGFANNNCSVITTILTKATSCSDGYIHLCCLISWLRKTTVSQRSWCLWNSWGDLVDVYVHLSYIPWPSLLLSPPCFLSVYVSSTNTGQNDITLSITIYHLTL